MKTYITITLFVFAMANGWCQTSLNEYVDFAVKNNPGLKASYAEFEAAMQRVPQMGALDDPTFRVSSFGQMVETRTGQQMARFSIEQMFPWFGTLKEQRSVAALNAEAAFETFKSKRNALAMQVKQAYYPLFEIDESIRLNEENLKILESIKTLTVSKFKNGNGKLSDALRVDIMTNEIKTSISILKERKKSMIVAFNLILNRDPEANVTIEKSDEIDTRILSRDSLAGNPTLEVLRKKVLAAQAQERVAQRQGMPKLGLGFEYIVTQKRPEMTFSDNGKDAYMAMVSVSLPIYRKKYKASIKESQLMQSSFSEMQLETENNLLAQYEMANFELERVRQEIALYTQQVKQTNQIITLLLTSYSNNNADIEEILEMQQTLLKYQLLEVASRTEYAMAMAELEFLTAHS